MCEQKTPEKESKGELPRTANAYAYVTSQDRRTYGQTDLRVQIPLKLVSLILLFDLCMHASQLLLVNILGYTASEAIAHVVVVFSCGHLYNKL